MRRLAGPEAGALAALGIILAITAAWWALALWPLPGDVAPWLVRTRAVCFGAVANGLPTTAGWMVLIGQPVYMLAALWLISGNTVRSALKALALIRAGRGVLAATAVLTIVGISSAVMRVARAADARVLETGQAFSASGDQVTRQDRAAPPLTLVDHRGEQLTLARFRGRPVFVTFAFAHCTTVCPLIVHDVLAAQRAAAELEPVVIVVTLDPWRDVPARLPAIATRWQLGPDAYIVGGAVADVEQTLDAWSVGRARDPWTGDITHAPVVYLVDRNGRIAFPVTGAGSAATIARLAERL